MPSITHDYTLSEWTELESEAKRQRRKVREFCRNSPLAIARVQQQVTASNQAWLPPGHDREEEGRKRGRY